MVLGTIQPYGDATMNPTVVAGFTLMDFLAAGVVGISVYWWGPFGKSAKMRQIAGGGAAGVLLAVKKLGG